MENKIRTLDLYVLTASFLSPLDRAKACLSHVSKTFRAACNRPSLVAADVKYAADAMKTAEYTGFSRVDLNHYTDRGYIAFYWLVISRLHNTRFNELWSSFGWLPLDFLSNDPTKSLAVQRVLTDTVKAHKKRLCRQMLLDVSMGTLFKRACVYCSGFRLCCPVRLCKDCTILVGTGDTETLRRIAVKLCGSTLRDYRENQQNWSVDVWENLLDKYTLQSVAIPDHNIVVYLR
jgi:hypothetical protein